MTMHIINVVRDFSPTSYGRYARELQPNEENVTGERFRDEFLIPALNQFDKVHVELTGYNRYGPSFIDEAFGGLISVKHFTLEDIHNRLTYSHDLLPSIVELITRRIEHAAQSLKD